jgi:hypothetical protein
MAFRKINYFLASCDGCGPVWPVFDPACVDGVPPHFVDRAAALEQLRRDYGWQIHCRQLGRPLMACRSCAAAGVIPAGALRGWLLAAAGWVRQWMPFGPVLRRVPPDPGAGHPESLTAELAPEDEELLAVIEADEFPES